jgi:para-nitrobenzyl esterase
MAMKRTAVFLGAACLAVLGCGSTASNGTGGNDAGGKDAGGKDSSLPQDAPTSETGAGGCTVVKTANGPVEGMASGTTCTYQGIPYAAPPTSSLRWKPPQPAASWTTPRPSAAQSGCPQTSSPFGTASTDEDCLYLNVWTPPATTGVTQSARPVMVFVHGGSFLYGSGTFGLYDGTKLATATGNVVVTLNYRLGALGFLSNAALRAEDPSDPTAGDYGILDQIAAFEWVQKNIASFGGSPSNVTIFGESAGGTSMFVHLTTPKSKGLFERVIVESGAAADGYIAIPQVIADGVGADFATAVGCTDTATLLTCLRGKSPTTLLAATPAGATSGWWPVTDGVAIPKEPMSVFADGSFTKVPTLVGNNKNEGTLFTYAAPPTDPSSYLALENASFPGHGAAIVAQYPISNYGGSYFEAASDALTDGVFLCPTRKVARAIAKGGTPTYRYDFVHAISFPLIPNLGAFHGSELLFVFGNKLDGITGLQSNELPLSNEMMAYWGRMATHGNPNTSGAFAWPAYQLTTEPEIVLDLTLSTETELKSAACDFWDSIGD